MRIMRRGKLKDSTIQFFRLAISVVVAITFSLYAENQLHPLTFTVPVDFSDFVIRILSCFLATILGCFIYCNQVLLSLSITLFYLFWDQFSLTRLVTIDC